MVSGFTFDVLVNFPFENEGITKCIMIKCWAGDLGLAHQALLSMGFSRQEYWNGMPFPPIEDFPDPGIKVASPASSTLAGIFFYHWATWEALQLLWVVVNSPVSTSVQVYRRKTMLFILIHGVTQLNSFPIQPSPLGSIGTRRVVFCQFAFSSNGC